MLVCWSLRLQSKLKIVTLIACSFFASALPGVGDQAKPVDAAKDSVISAVVPSIGAQGIDALTAPLKIEVKNQAQCLDLLGKIAWSFLDGVADEKAGRELFNQDCSVKQDKFAALKIHNDFVNDLGLRISSKNALDKKFSDNQLEKISNDADPRDLFTSNLAETLEKIIVLLQPESALLLAYLASPINDETTRLVLKDIVAKLVAKQFSAEATAIKDLEEQIKTFADIEAEAPQAGDSAPDAIKIAGVIISDFKLKSLTTKFGKTLYGTKTKYLGAEIFEVLNAIKASTPASVVVEPVVAAPKVETPKDPRTDLDKLLDLKDENNKPVELNVYLNRGYAATRIPATELLTTFALDLAKVALADPNASLDKILIKPDLQKDLAQRNKLKAALAVALDGRGTPALNDAKSADLKAKIMAFYTVVKGTLREVLTESFGALSVNDLSASPDIKIVTEQLEVLSKLTISAINKDSEEGKLINDIIAIIKNASTGDTKYYPDTDGKAAKVIEQLEVAIKPVLVPEAPKPEAPKDPFVGFGSEPNFAETLKRAKELFVQVNNKDLLIRFANILTDNATKASKEDQIAFAAVVNKEWVAGIENIEKLSGQPADLTAALVKLNAVAVPPAKTLVEKIDTLLAGQSDLTEYLNANDVNVFYSNLAGVALQSHDADASTMAINPELQKPENAALRERLRAALLPALIMQRGGKIIETETQVSALDQNLDLQAKYKGLLKVLTVAVDEISNKVDAFNKKKPIKNENLPPVLTELLAVEISDAEREAKKAVLDDLKIRLLMAKESLKDQDSASTKAILAQCDNVIAKLFPPVEDKAAAAAKAEAEAKAKADAEAKAKADADAAEAARIAALPKDPIDESLKIISDAQQQLDDVKFVPANWIGQPKEEMAKAKKDAMAAELEKKTVKGKELKTVLDDAKIRDKAVATKLINKLKAEDMKNGTKYLTLYAALIKAAQ